MNLASLKTGGFIRQGLLIFCIMLSLNVAAEEAPFRVFETGSLNIKLANDGTGIVRDIECSGCEFSFVKITAASKASVNGIEVDILRARDRAGKSAMVSFTPQTQEVQYIRWSE